MVEIRMPLLRKHAIGVLADAGPQTPFQNRLPVKASCVKPTVTASATLCPLSQVLQRRRVAFERRNCLDKAILISALVWIFPVAYAQVSPSFDVASVRTSPLAGKGGEGSTREAIEFSPTTLTMRDVTLGSCIRWAYDFKEFQIVGPGWLGSDRYDIIAKATDPVPLHRLRLMLQALLADRFRLAAHRDFRVVSFYALRVADRKPRLQPTKSDAPSGMRPSGGALEFHNMSMAELAERLHGRPFGIDRPVVDKTELAGTFDFTMKLAPNDAELKSSLERRESEQDTSLFIRPLRELGLKLNAERGPVEQLIIDHAERKHIEN